MEGSRDPEINNMGSFKDTRNKTIGSVSEPEGTPGIAGQPSAPFQRRKSLKASKGTCQLHRARGGEPRCSLSGSGSFHCPRALTSGISSGRKMTGEKHASFYIYRQESPLGDASQQSQKERGLKPCKEGTGGEGCGRDTRVSDSHSHSPSLTAQVRQSKTQGHHLPSLP